MLLIPYVIVFLICFTLLALAIYSDLHSYPNIKYNVEFRIVKDDRIRLQFRNSKYCFWTFIEDYSSPKQYNNIEEVKAFISKFYKEKYDRQSVEYIDVEIEINRKD